MRTEDKVNFKVTSWESVSFPSHLRDKVLEAMNTGRILDSNDLQFFIENELNEDAFYTTDYESVEQLTVEDNQNQATIEYEGDTPSEPLWSNT
jgi:hypothetical protein